MVKNCKREYVEAPAGHGKTEAIANEVQKHSGEKKILILTHTNAGVNSLRKRLKVKGVKSSKYDLYTIDSFSLKFAKFYPSVSGIPKKFDGSKIDYKKAREGAIRIFNDPDLKNYLRFTYAYSIVDEYQDCSKTQHELILTISEEINCLVFGDPMQSIFDFDNEGFSWEQDLCMSFTKHPSIDLRTPHRWIKHGNNDLGNWIYEIRSILKEGRRCDLRLSPLASKVIIHSCSTTKESFSRDMAFKISNILSTSKPKGSVLILVHGGSERPHVHHSIAKTMYMPIQSIETLESKKLMNFLKALDTFLRSFIRKPISLYNLLRDDLAKPCMSNTPALPSSVKTKLELYPQKSVSDLRSDGSRLGGNNKRIYDVILDIYDAKNSQKTVKNLLVLMDIFEKESTKIVRKELWRSAKEALKKYLKEENVTLEECGFEVRQRLSFIGRNFLRVIGNTLLTKGLEFDHVIIVDPASLTDEQLYVSISRACKTIEIVELQ